MKRARGQGVTPERLDGRRQLLRRIGDDFPSAAAPLATFRGFQDLAYEVLTTPQLRDCFDPKHIDARVKERYGNTLFGNSAFIATKLVTAGVKFVNVIWTWYYGSYPGVADYGWDTHEYNFSILRRTNPANSRLTDGQLHSRRRIANAKHVEPDHGQGRDDTISRSVAPTR